MKRSTFLLLISITIFLTACGAINTPEETAESIQIRLPMGYIPDPQYAPFYVAVEKGYFAEEGIDLEFDYSFETDGMALVGANELPFAIVGGDQVILARAQGVPVVYVFEWFQRYPIAVVSKAEMGIKTPQDMVGHTIGLPGFFGASYVGFAGLLSTNDMTQDDVEALEVGFTQVETLLSDQADAVVVFANNEPIQLQNLGEDINIIQVADYIDLVFNGIVTNEETLHNNPELVKRFLRPLMRGLLDTLADPDAAYEISKKYVEGLDDGRRAVLEASLPMWQAETLGLTDAASWEQTEAILLEMGFLDEPVNDLSAGYTNEFVNKLQP
ncbi:MAG: ABC transporter substrate-binding protein [Anaerolineales bacterium]|nr:ABC transporter substrate-binding protein [Anaerolineales bacterium]